MVHEALQIIKDEHQSLAAVLHGLLYLTREIRDRGADPDFRLLHAMLDYIVAFPQKLHHPKEDQYLFKAIRERSANAAQLLDELEAEHVRGDDLIRSLQHALIGYENEGRDKAELFRKAVEDYADFNWRHMRREEDVVMPLAEQLLTEADWERIAAAFRQNDDPLFGIKPKDEFRRLFQRIVALAPPPLGVGPGRP